MNKDINMKPLKGISVKFTFNDVEELISSGRQSLDKIAQDLADRYTKEYIKDMIIHFLTTQPEFKEKYHYLLKERADPTFYEN